MTNLEFVNDVERLEWAVQIIGEWKDYSYIDIGRGYDEDEDKLWEALAIVHEYVPLLIKSYEELFKSSMELTAAWEAFMANQTPQGIYIPEAPSAPF